MKTLTGKVITAPGVKPNVSVKWGRENFWIYGAIEPLTGDHFLHEYPKLNGDYFQEFLNWLSQQLGEDYAILQIDQASAHMTSAICWPENIIPLAQPPHSPELKGGSGIFLSLSPRRTGHACYQASGSSKSSAYQGLQDLRNWHKQWRG